MCAGIDNARKYVHKGSSSGREGGNRCLNVSKIVVPNRSREGMVYVGSE